MTGPLELVHLCLSPGWGGLEMYLHRVGPPLVARGHAVRVVCLEGSRIAEACAAEGLPVHTLRAGPFGLGALLPLTRLLREQRPDLLHVHASRSLGVTRAAAALAGGVPLVFTEHMGGRRPKKDPYHRWVYAGVDRVLSISDEVLRRNRAALPLPPERIQRLYYGLDLSRFDPQALPADRAALRLEFGLPAARTLVGLVARISPMKGHELLLEAALPLLAEHPDLDLVFAGGAHPDHGGDPALVRRLREAAAASGHADRVHLPGFTPRVPEVTACLDLACVCSDDEAFGLTTIEALAMARPVVASRSGALPEIVRDGETGLLYTARDPASLRDALRRLLDDPALAAELGSRGRADVVERFSLERHLSGLEEVYAEVLASRAAP